MTENSHGRIITPETENGAINLEAVDVYVNSHPVGDEGAVHTHDVDHILVMRSGRMRWTVANETIDSGAGDVIVAPAGVDHSFKVLGEEEVKLLCIESRKAPLQGT